MIRLLLLTSILLLIPVASPLHSALKASSSPATILVLGDSLSASYGLDRESGWVWLLENRLRERGLDHRIVNASISGETTSGGLTRLGPLLERHSPDLVVIELGANDGLRGLGLDVVRHNLSELVRRAQEGGSRVLLVAVPLPPNYGEAYTSGFQAVFEEVAESRGVALVANLLAGIAEDWDLMQADGLHPTAEAQPLMLGNVWPLLEPLLTPAGIGPGHTSH